uniref:hypothetical protein n=1 Tax=Escherichia coli TaxID=562 RepID=UPI001BC8A5CF
QAGAGLGHDLAQGGFCFEGHAAIVEPSPGAAAAGAGEHGLGSAKAGIRSGSVTGHKEGLSAPLHGPGRFSLSHSQLQDESGEVQCPLIGF